MFVQQNDQNAPLALPSARSPTLFSLPTESSEMSCPHHQAFGVSPTSQQGDEKRRGGVERQQEGGTRARARANQIRRAWATAPTTWLLQLHSYNSAAKMLRRHEREHTNPLLNVLSLGATATPCIRKRQIQSRRLFDSGYKRDSLTIFTLPNIAQFPTTLHVKRMLFCKN